MSESAGLRTLPRPLVATVRPRSALIWAVAGLAYFVALLGWAALWGDTTDATIFFGLAGMLCGTWSWTEVDGFVMDDDGIRGTDGGDRLSWEYVSRVELADVTVRHPHTRVLGRYGNELRISPRHVSADHDEHPAELVRREAEARGIDVVGDRPVVSTLGHRLALGTIAVSPFVVLLVVGLAGT